MLTRERAWDLLFCDASPNKHNEIESFVYNNEIWHFWRFFFINLLKSSTKLMLFSLSSAQFGFPNQWSCANWATNMNHNLSLSIFRSSYKLTASFWTKNVLRTDSISSTGKFDNQSNHFNFNSFPMNCIIHCSDRESGQILTKSTRTHFAKENCEFWIDIPPTKWISFPSTEIDQ